MAPQNVNPLQWHQALGVARQSCARFFRDGRGPGEAMRAFGLSVEPGSRASWAKAVEAIACSLCAPPLRHAA
jgi:hypothetical protein